jgi:uncharacterized protein YggE
MKRSIILSVILMCLAVSSSAQEIDKLPVITVLGTAEVQIAPDEAVCSVDVSKTNKDLQTAKRLNDESVGKILELTRRFSILPQNVQTTQIAVDMKYESIRDPKTRIFSDEGDEIGKRVFKGYVVSKTVTVRLTDLSRFEEFFAEVLQTGVSSVNNIRFETSKLRENKDKAREMAMKAAKEKATAMAAAVGQNIGRAVKITEASVGGQPFMNYAANSNAIGTAGVFTESVATFAAGAIKIEAQVTVSFQLN